MRGTRPPGGAPGPGGAGEPRFVFPAKENPPAAEPVVERLLPHAIASEDEPALAFVPDGEGEHADQSPRELDGRQVLREVGDDLGVAVRGEGVSRARELFSQLTVVVDLAVEHGNHAPVLVRDRRVAGDQVDDRQPSLANRRATGLEATMGVGTAVVEHRELTVDDRAVVVTVACDYSGDAAHRKRRV